MSTLPASFDDFLSEFSASLRGPSGEASLRRINAERVLKLVLDDIVEQRHDVQIRVLNDSRIAGDSGADILMQIDDYDVRLEILDAQENIITLGQDQLKRFKTIFEENPSTETLVITWTTDVLDSLQLALSEIDQLTNQPAQVQNLIRTTRPLSEVINEILESRIKVWEKILSTPQEHGKSETDIRKLFDGHFHTCLEEERGRSFKLDERKRASALVSEKEAAILLNGVLDQALSGEHTEVLVKRFLQLPRRGGK